LFNPFFGGSTYRKIVVESFDTVDTDIFSFRAMSLIVKPFFIKQLFSEWLYKLIKK
jgi:hypothetical protein